MGLQWYRTRIRVNYETSASVWGTSGNLTVSQGSLTFKQWNAILDADLKQLNSLLRADIKQINPIVL